MLERSREETIAIKQSLLNDLLSLWQERPNSAPCAVNVANFINDLNGSDLTFVVKVKTSALENALVELGPKAIGKVVEDNWVLEIPSKSKARTLTDNQPVIDVRGISDEVYFSIRVQGKGTLALVYPQEVSSIELK